MFSNKALMIAATALGFSMGLCSLSSAQLLTPAQQAQINAAAKQRADQYAKESGWTQQGNSSGSYLFKSYNNLNQDIWVTYYNAATGNHEGEACVPPGKALGIASSDWASYGAYVQIEVKQDFNCGGGNTSQAFYGKSGAGNGWSVVSGGTSHITVSGTPGSPSVQFIQ